MGTVASAYPHRVSKTEAGALVPRLSPGAAACCALSMRELATAGAMKTLDSAADNAQVAAT
ncbi:hypothetical protein SVIO_001650 [Streptomyces violaceusniger]|uniref:Uncharacterized protein n=1 Tax=Streptomyces violaceusniger TaxID=68280 RepID=A0A4D4KLT9_STRVO|nr:hypothetical protein SVIO_001650 [Streptomyces violaceusniger]